ncbi:MAG: 3-phosphoshikimate 1-carboxyvinyltransferase [Lachnospiraceae bacterium]|nr:3-phosphoshikimate 1-carboxyvinyltransferase [Lachnospiraceae bacterium]
MDITVASHQIKNARLEAISSKSFVHRELIAAALSGGKWLVGTNIFSEDMKATAECLRAMGAKILTNAEGFLVDAPVKEGKSVTLNCKESGSTARFLLPVAACLYDEVSLTGEGRLPERPFGPLCEALRDKGVEVSGDHLPIQTRGKLTAGEYRLPGNVSSQYVTGLLLALPLLKGPSGLLLTTELSSKEYVDITLRVLSDHGVRIGQEKDRYLIPGNGYSGGSFNDTGDKDRAFGGIAGEEDRIFRAAEGDWSNGGYLLCMGAIKGEITLEGLSAGSVQGDRAVLRVLEDFGAAVRTGPETSVKAGELHGIDLDAENIPDLVPALAVVAAFAEGNTVFRNVGRLRIKESDRIEQTGKLLWALGVRTKVSGEGNGTSLTVFGEGGKLRTTQGEVTVDSGNDHRIAMAAAIAAFGSSLRIRIRGAEAVNKSYPGFFSMCRDVLGMEIREVI